MGIGVQICAIIDTIQQIDQILRHPASGLILSVTWSDTSGFILDIDFPTAGIIHLGSGIRTDPIELQINMKPLRLMIDAGLKIPVSKSSNPLDFKLALSIQNEEIYASGQIIGNWNNPFAFGFAGGLSIGNVRGDVAIQINEDPSRDGKIEHLGIQGLVKFTSDVIGVDLLSPPDFIDFEKISLYISTGVMIGITLYPPGFSFEADIKITPDILIAKAAIHNLKVDLLSVTGSKGGDATFDLAIGLSKQHLAIYGAIDVLGNEISLLLNLNILPIPKLYFGFSLYFTPLLTFSVNAQMKRAADLQDLSKLEFVLHAVMGQYILDYVAKQVCTSLEAAKEAAEESIEAAERKVEQVRGDMNKAIADAQQKVEETHAAWRVHEKESKARSGKLAYTGIGPLQTRSGKLEAQVDAAKMEKAEADVIKARRARDDDIRKEEELERVA
ncbi:hypothetical protein AX16_001955 [Volvariella volvacea WC 439]|nr:hypothetical protein AX16_001955 [Volvariella volvacea WC 439]